ncbi:carbohydrate ABC transporter permease [Paenibacillus sp. FSL L8-0493]|uniref:carbohydrate ABC transporter permease n=1 Tax=Paenibacillus TaxID=44249 RepID=UPI00096C354E|nr:carbohydrate ABC transporter permease [Paenibacillus odorifer]OME19344.1 sugar ABC transporter permease [Paenibacillus odorifer]OME26975.1 sugar ABC transporter permease [Paenibacillus odorifer]OME33066.1 sugar ABC transporter permease [Paenibacillus odorifer]
MTTTHNRRWPKVVLQLAFLIFAVIQLYPLVWLVFSSFKTNIEITGSNVMGLPNEWRWANYDYALFKANIARNFLNSLMYTTVTVIISALLSAMVSFAVARMKWKLNNVVLTFFMLGLMIPVHATLLPVFQMLKMTSLLNTLWALIIPYTVSALPTTIFIMIGFFRALPGELEEASVVDGCNIYQVFFRIMLPLVKPAIVTTSIFTFLSAWNELMFANTFINDPDLATITVAINSFKSAYATEFGPMFAGMVVATLPMIIIYLFLSNQVQKSIIAGAVKG